MPKRVDYISYETATHQLNCAADPLIHAHIICIKHLLLLLLLLIIISIIIIIKGYFLNRLYHCIL